MKKVLVLISIIMVLGTIGCTAKKDSITNDEAVFAIKNYCYKNNPDLEEMEKSQDHIPNCLIIIKI